MSSERLSSNQFEYLCNRYDELRAALWPDLHAIETTTSRGPARAKCAQLPQYQLLDLCTDVCDEIKRRKKGPFSGLTLMLGGDKALQSTRLKARRKLAKVPESYFKDLIGDVYVELGRRYPHLKEPDVPVDVVGVDVDVNEQAFDSVEFEKRMLMAEMSKF